MGTFSNLEKASDQHRERLSILIHNNTSYHHPHSQKTQIVAFLKTLDVTWNIYTDQTGRFPVTSSKGNKYILVAYHYESNTIHEEPLKTRSGLDLTTAYQKLHRLLTKRGLKPHLHILDNECPNVLKNIHEWGKQKHSVSPAAHPSQKLSRTGHPDLQVECHSQIIYHS